MLALCGTPTLWADVCDGLPAGPPKGSDLFGRNDPSSFKLSVTSGGTAFRITVRPLWRNGSLTPSSTKLTPAILRWRAARTESRCRCYQSPRTNQLLLAPLSMRMISTSTDISIFPSSRSMPARPGTLGRTGSMIRVPGSSSRTSLHRSCAVVRPLLNGLSMIARFPMRR